MALFHFSIAKGCPPCHTDYHIFSWGVSEKCNFEKRKFLNTGITTVRLICMRGLTKPLFLGSDLSVFWWLISQLNYRLCLEAQAAHLFLSAPVTVVRVSTPNPATRINLQFRDF